MTSIPKATHDLRFCLTAEHECSYLSDQLAVTLFVEPDESISMQNYRELAALGFRRSGNHVYRPHCANCALCIPVRLNVNTFMANRSQRRNQKKNSEIQYRIKDARFYPEHYALYRKYMQHRHPGGGMDNDDNTSYEHLICADWSDSKLMEFYLEQQLVMVAVVDVFENGISAVYTFFDPDFSQLGLGVFGILSEIKWCQYLHKDWLYLGYWNPKSAKMQYKQQYRPIEFFNGQEWQLLDKN